MKSNFKKRTKASLKTNLTSYSNSIKNSISSSSYFVKNSGRTIKKPKSFIQTKRKVSLVNTSILDDNEIHEKSIRLSAWVKDATIYTLESKKRSNSLESSSDSDVIKSKRSRNRMGRCQITSTDQSKSLDESHSQQSYSVKQRRMNNGNENVSNLDSENIRVTRARKQALNRENNKKHKLTISNAKNCQKSNKENYADDCKHYIRIKLTGQSIIGGEPIILEASYDNNGWIVNYEEPANTIIKCTRKPGYQVANFDISINPFPITADNAQKNDTIAENKVDNQASIDNFFKVKKYTSDINKSKTIMNPMVVLESDYEQNIAPVKSVKKILNQVENTTILNSLFSSNETLLQETQENHSRLRIKTIKEINDAIETITIKDDESENNFCQSLAIRQVLKNKKINKKKKVCPDFKLIQGTPFAVDAFNFGDLLSQGVEIYFLTHFHSDHYVGLNKKFCRPLFCSQTTANLLDKRIKIDKRFVNILELNKPTIINDVEVTALDANHCPGSIMLLFNISGKFILHTGDFRANYEMELYPALQNIEVERLYLDTTYCKRQYTFPTQEESIKQAINFIKSWLIKDVNMKILVVVGSYLIGKEKMWLGLSKALKRKVWVDKSRLDLIKSFEDAMYVENIITDPNQAEIHVLPIMDLKYEKMSKYLEKFNGVFNHVIVIRPSGWEFKQKPFSTIGNVTIRGIAYSEHSSYEELKRFVTFIKPKKIIATAGNENQLHHLYRDCGLRDPNINTIDKYFKKQL